jgi:hypothetical protein
MWWKGDLPTWQIQVPLQGVWRFHDL